MKQVSDLESILLAHLARSTSHQQTPPAHQPDQLPADRPQLSNEYDDGQAPQFDDWSDRLK